MTGLWAIYRRELLSQWVSPLGWVLLSVFLLLQGLGFYTVVVHASNQATLSVDSGPLVMFFGESIFVLASMLLLCPALTMRLLAEEKRSGTLETLLTAPVTPAAVVTGKYLAVLTTYLTMWLPTLLYPLILRQSMPIDWPVVVTSYLGVTGVGAGYLAIGTLMSALSSSQLVAFVLTVLVEFGLFLLGVGEYVFEPGPLFDLCSHVSVFSQLGEFARGLVELRRVVFDLSLVLTPLFLAARVVDSWRWD